VKVKDLLARLEECDPSATVLLATQPGWPLQFKVAGVAESADLGDPDGGWTEDDPCSEHGRRDCVLCLDVPHVVYLVEGGHPDHPYAPGGVWEVAR
jgi:hypothetical protein